MFLALVVVTILFWLAVGLYSLGAIRSIRRRAWVIVPGVVIAAGLTALTYQEAKRQEVKQKFQKHYLAAIDERDRGNLDEAERQLEEARNIIPGHPEVEREIREINKRKPADKRVQSRAVRVDPNATPPQTPPSTPPPKPPANAPAPTPDKRVGEQPKVVAHKVSPFEIIHYALDVTLDPEAHSLAATATIRVRSRGKEVKVLDFSLHPECKPSAVEVDGKPARFQHPNDLLAVTPDRPLSGKREAVVRVTYARTGDAAMGGGVGHISPEGCYFISEARWYPATGELDFRSPVRLHATVPKGFTVVSVGELKGVRKDEKTSTFQWETDRFASMLSLAAAKYVQQSVKIPRVSQVAPTRGDLAITCYTYPEHRQSGAAFLKEAAAVVRYYERRFGTYPFEKLALAEIPIFPGGYGSTSFVMLLDRSFGLEQVPREFLAHEIAHQWWGNSVFPQGMGAAWLTEAFANYSAWMYEAAVAGNPRVLQKRVREGTNTFFEAMAARGDQSIYESDPYLQVGARTERIYEKGAVILHMLRREIGDAAFQRTLRRFADERRFGLAKIEDFRKVAESEHGKPLGWFFDQWLGRKGGMELQYSFETKAMSATQNEAVLRVTQTAPAYRARMKVTLQVENSVETREIEITQAQQEFRFPVTGKLQSVLLDPDNDFLMLPPRWVVGDGE